MDIIDIILARALTPEGQTDIYVGKTSAAAAKAEKAEQDAEAAIATVNNAAEDIASKQEAAASLLEQAQDALETAQQAVINMPTAYNTTGQNTDGYMTQKAVTDALDTKVNTTILNNYATTTYVNQQIAAIPSSGMPGGVSNLGIDNAGKIVVIGPDGNIISGAITEETLINALVQTGAYDDTDTLGIIIDYTNKNCERTAGAQNRVAGSDFNAFAMYGGRMRCNVTDDGTINAFYGDNNYTEDGSNGQVMIYQPKFYYQRLFIEEYMDTQGHIITKEQLLISPTMKIGFKIHPLFMNGEDELDYVLLPVYEGSVYDTSEHTYIVNNSSNIDINNDQLSSIADVQPLSGANKNLTASNLKQLAINRGTGWTLTNAQFESALQMLAIVELGNLNGQDSLVKGLVNASNLGSMITGSTANLGNATGRATATSYSGGSTETNDDKVAIAYRGMENPWGNLWRLVDNLTVKAEGASQGGIVYLNNISLQQLIPNTAFGWISNMGYGMNEYDWLYIPIKCGNNANSAVPVGDSMWATTNLNGTNLVLIGGTATSTDGAGFFNYSFDVNASSKINQTNARIMFIPTKNTIYSNNIIKWKQKSGG